MKAPRGRPVFSTITERDRFKYSSTATQATLHAAFSHLLRDWPQCQARAERGRELAGQRGFGFLHAGFTTHRGVALAWQGCVEEGIAVLRQGLDALLATGTRMLLACWYTRLGEIYLLAGRGQEGLEAAEESFRYDEEVWWLPEQHRVRAELLLLAPGNEAEAEAGFRKALEVARRQTSKSLELRAAMSPARLLRQQGRAAEGRNLLAVCYSWFTEGFHTPDLQDARELLDTLERDCRGYAPRGMTRTERHLRRFPSGGLSRASINCDL